MPRHPRLFIPGAIYHVYCRVARGEIVFDDDCEAIEFVETLREIRDLDRWTILAWCLMGNHYHLVIKTRTVDLWRSMARLQGRISRSHNRRHRYLGRLWQSRYRARVIDCEVYFRQVIAYVHLNPVSAGIVEDPADYVYSGHREIVGRCSPHVVDLRSVLIGFGDGRACDAVTQYQSWIRSVAEARWEANGISDLPWWTPARHVDEIATPDGHPDAQMFDGQRLAEERAELRFSEFIDRYRLVSGRDLEELASRHRSAKHIRGRIELCVLAISRYGLRACDIAALLGKGRNSITRWLNKGLVKERDDPDFAARIDSLDSSISQQ
ncbi:MAG: transposase [Candidatus Sulfomarinibacteraceae bacterium]